MLLFMVARLSGGMEAENYTPYVRSSTRLEHESRARAFMFVLEVSLTHLKTALAQKSPGAAGVIRSSAVCGQICSM